MLVNFIVLLVVITLLIIIICIQNNLNSSPEQTNICSFKLSRTKIRKKGMWRVATFRVKSKNQHLFFVNFPLSFKFYSDNKFKTKIKVKYKTSRDGKLEEIIRKTINFESKSIIYQKNINDIIIGDIYIEIYSQSLSGRSTLEFNILKNRSCILDREYKKIIKFPPKRNFVIKKLLINFFKSF